jgi:hypothetical protein
VKSPNKNDYEEIKSTASEKKIIGGIKADNN